MDKMILDRSTIPYFDPDHSKNVTSVTGGRALMNNLENRTVSKQMVMNCGRWQHIVVAGILDQAV